MYSNKFSFLQETVCKKHVTFNPKLEIRYMHVWKYASRQARISPWLTIGADRTRFQRRIEKTATIINPVLLRKINEIKTSKEYYEFKYPFPITLYLFTCV